VEDPGGHERQRRPQAEEHPRGNDLRRIFEPGPGLVEAALRAAGCAPGRLAAIVLSTIHPRREPEFAAGLAERLGVPVLSENDANLGALGESVFGGAAGSAASCTSSSATTSVRAWSSAAGWCAARPATRASSRTCRCGRTARSAAAAGAAAWQRWSGLLCEQVEVLGGVALAQAEVLRVTATG
jgi:hypothetical protein